MFHDVRTPRELYMDSLFDIIVEEASLMRPLYMTQVETISILIDERFERGILSREERKELQVRNRRV